MREMLRPNLSLLTARSNKSPHPDHFFVADKPSETKAAESTVQSYLFPLFLYVADDDRRENLSPEFRAFLESQYDHHYAPEEILGYIYAVLHAPAYRTRYAGFLRTEFPRVPFPESVEDFEALSILGWSLVQAHLLRDLPPRGLAAYEGKGDHRIEAVRYSPAERAIWINKAQCFKPVPPEAWNFHIGGYQVLDKYLKSRKGRTLSLEEIDHVSAVAESLVFTIDRMVEIDAVYQKAFPATG
jgi:predicted helicase